MASGTNTGLRTCLERRFPRSRRPLRAFFR
jgi:hypothetical protein